MDQSFLLFIHGAGLMPAKLRSLGLSFIFISPLGQCWNRYGTRSCKRQVGVFVVRRHAWHKSSFSGDTAQTDHGIF